MSDILARIAAYKREEVAARKAARPLGRDGGRAPRDAVRAPRLPRRAGARPRPGPPGPDRRDQEGLARRKGLIRADFDPPALARAYEAGGAACLSVLTDAPSFQGADDYLVGRARRRRPCPACARTSWSIPGRWPRAGRWAPTPSW